MGFTIKTMTVALAMGLAGCSFSPIGDSRFDCNRKENPSEFCRSFKALVRSTDGPLPESRFDQEFRMSDYDRANGIAPDRRASPLAPQGAAPTGASRLPHRRPDPVGDPVAGLPVRQAPVVQRVFIKRFVDDNDSLQDDMIAYHEVRGARWSGFETRGQDARPPGAYPHRASAGLPIEADMNAPLPQQTNLAQPGGATDGAAGSAMSPAGSQSGDVNAPNAER
jgi:hypothetical protein